MYQTNPGLEDVVANSMSSLSFSGVTLVFALDTFRCSLVRVATFPVRDPPAHG